MQKQGKSRKSLVIGIVAAIVILAVLLVLLLTQCTGGQSGATTAPSTTVATDEVPTYELYWNLDRDLYAGKSEAGMSSRMPESDGYFHVRFILDGQEVTLKVQDRKIINKLDVMDLMGLEFDENGIVIDVIHIDDLPLEKVAWQFYVQSAGGKVIKANSSESFEGMEVQLDGNENTGIYDMTGKSGPIGCETTPIELDRIYAVKNLAGEVTHVFLYERINYMLTHEGECQHCEKTVTWYEWVRTDKLPTTSGHYQLQNDIQLTAQQSLTNQDQKICLDLNGKRVDGKSGARVYSLHNTGSSLAIMDTSEGQTGVLAAHGTGDQGMVVWVRYGQFHFYGGTLDGSDASTKLYGTTVQVPKNSYMYMYGGTIIGGTAKYVQNEKTGAYSRGYGGTMMVAGKFVMNDGEIRDGFAQSVTYKKNGTSTTTRGYGGNIFVSSTGEVELKGGVIKNGKAGSAGGNLYMDGACTVTIDGTKIQGGCVTGKGKNGGSVFVGSKGTLLLKSGSISGGYSYNAGGNVYVNGVFTMSGGSIYGGKCYTYSTKKLNETSTNYNLFLVNGTFKMYGGRIYGGVGVTDTSLTDNKTAYVGLATYATIKSDEENATNLTLNTGGKIVCRVDTLRDSASIGVNTARGIFTDPTLEANKDKFFSDIEEAEIIYTEQGLALGRMNCVCGKTDTHINGCDGTVYLWSPWTSATSAPKTEGNYYLIKDVTTTAQTVVTKGDTVRLDLNGHNMTYKVPATSADGYRLYRSAFESLLVITDTTDKPGTMRSVMASEAEVLAAVQAKVEDGTYTQEDADKRIAAQKAGNFGQVLWARGGDIVVHNGILDGSNLRGSKSGMTVYVGPNTASEDGGVTRKGSFTMYGGTIKGATSSASGCSVYGTGNSIVNIHGGVIENGVSTAGSGGNIYVSGQFLMDGGIVRGGKVLYSGGNIVIDGSKANATITGTAQVLDGTAGDPEASKDAGRGGNIRVTTAGAVLTIDGEAIVSGGTVYRSANSKAGYGGNISVNTGTTLNLQGGTVEKGTSTYRAGSIDVCGTLNISGGTVTGGSARYGGNIYAIEGASINISGGTVEGGSATSSGGNIYTYAPMTVSGGMIDGGKAHAADGVSVSGNIGGNIYTVTDLTVSGGTIQNGFAGAYGGNIYATTASSSDLYANVTISGNAKILNGTADAQGIDGLDAGSGGNIRMMTNTTLTVKDDALISGGKVIGGKYNSTTKKGGGGHGGNLTFSSATINLLGGVIENGTSNSGGGNISANAIDGTLVMDGVVIRGGQTDTYGGNIRILGSGIKLIQIKGNTQILNGTANVGGNIYIAPSVEANVEMSGGVISGGQAASDNNGGNVWIDDKTTFKMSGDALIDATGSVCKRGGAIYMEGGEFSMTDDAKLIGSDEVVSYGGAAYLRKDVEISGNAQIVGGSAGSTGGVVYFHSGKMTISDDAFIDGTDSSAVNGSAMYIYSSSADVTVQDNAKIIGGKSTSNGGTIYMANGQLSLTDDASIVGCESGRHGGAIYMAAGELTIDGGTVAGGKTASDRSGGAIYATGADSSVVMNGGTVDGGEAKYGGAVYIFNGATFTLNDGVIKNGKATSGGNVVVEADANAAVFTMNGGTVEGGTATGNGGNVWMYNNGTANAKFVMNGGTITGGTAATSGGNIYMTAGTVATMANGQIVDGDAQKGSGGNVYTTGSFTMENGTISGGMNGTKYSGSSKPNGGNVYVGSAGTFTMNGGSVTDGKTINTGGNFVVYGHLEMTGGTIKNGKKVNSSGEVVATTSNTMNVYVINATMRMTGGSIAGSTALYKDSKLTMSGDVSLNSGVEGAADLYLNGTSEPITIEGSLGQERVIARVRVSSGESYVISTATEAGNEKYFAAYEEGLSVFRNGDGKLEIGKVGCICGSTDGNHIGDCDGTEHQWSAWTDTDSVPTADGYWYLTEDVTITGKLSGKPEANTTVAVDLNGHTVNYGANNGYRLYTTYNGGHKNNIKLIFTDRSTAKDGKIVGTNQTQAENGPIVWLSCKGTELHVYHITIDGRQLGTKADKLGGVISATGSNAVVGIYNATILGGTSERGDAISITGEDAVLRLEGDVNITATEGDAINWGSTQPIDISKLTSVASDITIYGEGTFTTGFEGDDVKWFTAGSEDRIVEMKEGELKLSRYYCICGMPDGKHVEGFCDGTKYVWEPWTSTTTVPATSGNYYLTANVTSNTNTITTERDIKIDLNGFNITRSGSGRVYSTQYSTNRAVPVSIVLTNTATDDESVIKVTAAGDQGHVVWLSGYNKSLKVYNLTVDTTAANYSSQTYALHGKAFSINSQTTSIADAKATMEIYNTVFNAPDGTGSGAGSVISASAGIGQTVKLKDVTINGGYGYQVKKNTTDTYFGNGGAIMMSMGDLIMENVTISGAKAKVAGGAIYLAADAAATLSGKIVIEGELVDGTPSGIHMVSGATIDVSGLTVDSKIGISGDEGVISANTYEESDPDLAYLSTDNSEQYLVIRDGKLNLLGKECMCGMPDGKHVAGFCDKVLRAWQPWSGNTAPAETGNYYLTGDLTVTKTVDLSQTDAEIVIDLNGHDIIIPNMGDGETSRLYTTHNANGSTSDVSIKFTNRASDDSTVKVTGAGDEGRVMWMKGSNKKFAVYNVDFDLSAATTTNDARKDGLLIDIEGSGNTADFYDANITGGTSYSFGNVMRVDNGNSVTMTRCQVAGCVSTNGESSGNGGFAYVRGTMTLNNCTIRNVSAVNYAGAIYLYGASETQRAKLIVNGGSFEECEAAYGGAINVQQWADIELNSVSFSGNSATSNGGDIAVYAGCTATVENCSFENSQAGSYGGAVYLHSATEGSPAKLKMTGGTIDGCESGSYGGAIMAGTSNSNNPVTYTEVELTGTTIQNCSAKGRAGAIHVSNGSTLVADGCIIKNCSVTGTSRGGGLYSYKGNITLLDTTIENNATNGTSPLSGGVHLYQCAITLGGKIVVKGNTAGGNASGIYIQSSTRINAAADRPLSSESEIGVYAESGAAKTLSETLPYSVKDCFYSNQSALQIIHDGSALRMVSASEHWHCVCGGQITNDPNHECVDVEFTAIDALAGGTEMETGNYYMTDSFTITKGATNYVMYLSDVDVKLCLNGKTLTGATGDRSFYLRADTSAELTLTSCEADAKLTNASKYEGGLIKLFGKTNTLNLYGGVTIDGSAHTNTSTSTYGAAIHSKGTVNMYNATVIGSAKTTNATAGGALTVASNSVMNMYGGTIRDGMSQTNTGNVYLSGTLNMMGGTITGGGYYENDATNYEHRAANMRISASGVLNMTGGTINGHVYAGVSGATVKISGKANIYDDTRSLWIVPGNTNLYIGKMESGAKVHLNVLTSSSSYASGVIASGLNDYAITEADLAYFLVTKTDGTQNSDLVLNDDNTVSAVAMN